MSFINNALSKCHFAQVMENTVMAKHIGARPETIYQCSYCGVKCSLISPNTGVGIDLELTIRRWADGDCTIDGLFQKIRTDKQEVFNRVADAMRLYLQDGKPKYEWQAMTMSWEATESDKPSVGSSERTASGKLAPTKIKDKEGRL